MLTRRHDAGPASLTQLRALLARARRDGHAEEDGFVTPGFASVAAPVLDHSGHPTAAVAVTFPAGEGDPGALAIHVRRSAALVSARIRGSSRNRSEGFPDGTGHHASMSASGSSASADPMLSANPVAATRAE